MPSETSATWRADRFLRDLIRPACWLGLLSAVVGTIALGSVWFALGCGVCLSADCFVIARWSAPDHELPAELTMAAAMALLTGRMAVRAALLIAFAFLTPRTAFYGAITGSLIYDAVLFSLGSVRAAREAFPRDSRKEGKPWKDFSTRRTSSS